MKNYFVWLFIGIILAGCSPKPAVVPLPESVGSRSTGPMGLSKVEVSDGVVLLTPGQPYDLLSMKGGISNVAGFATPTMMPTVDPASVVMPEGIPLYPGATSLQVPSEEELSFGEMNGLSGSYVIFYTTDSNDQVVRFYSEKAMSAGWSVMDTQTEPDYDGTISQIWSKEKTLLLLQTWPVVDGLMKVQISWM